MKVSRRGFVGAVAVGGLGTITDIVKSDDASISDRLRRFFVSNIDIMGMMLATNPILQTVFGDAPQGMKIFSVHYDHTRRAFCFVLCHPSFDQVPAGEEIPIHTGPTLNKTYRIINEEFLYIEDDGRVTT